LENRVEIEKYIKTLDDTEEMSIDNANDGTFFINYK
jgi:hypothetical protein